MMSDAPALTATSDAPKVEQPAPFPPPQAYDNGEFSAALNRLDGFAVGTIVLVCKSGACGLSSDEIEDRDSDQRAG